ncbi:MAG TPA: trypsin-like peptidase domain-containing protein [Spirochaetota bacterium]|nr:trypsin-like peptidase domain-containing protein [Spirochaetota bacterium]HOD14333.1 trypsin-like peptidase domain-containing protein [Spirochaetota bacterium]HPG51420.1 trypsin-like peptidase domain-containing protein [Spirochaetota bacterium]HPN12564.1 trypsin-like peptidase domain-containing protein [Spirochaetota bacterium]
MKIKAITILILLYAATAPGKAGADTFLDETGRESPLKKKNRDAPVYELQKTFQSIYEQYRNSVVFISTEKTVRSRYSDPFLGDPFFRNFFGLRRDPPETRKQMGLGTGFIVSGDGYICTNRHVIEGMDSVTVRVSDRDYTATLVGSDQLTDIALLKITDRGRFAPVIFGNSDSVRIGDMAVAIGNPFGLDKTITTGVVSATGRHVYNDAGISHIQTDASINPGNSGGPLINLDGEVIGVNRMIYSSTGGSLGIGFAIPINTVRDTLVQLRQHGKVRRGYIGVQISPLTDATARELGLAGNEGALIAGLEKGGPAEQAGIRVRDVITGIAGAKIRNYTDLLTIVGKSAIGKPIGVTVWRKMGEVTVEVIVRERP